MENYYSIGNVIKIDRVFVTILTKHFRNLKTIIYNGKDHIGVFVGSFVGILRGDKKIVVQILSESTNNTIQEFINSSFSGKQIRKELIAKIIGVFEENNYKTRINDFPLIFDDVILLSKSELKKIYYLPNNDESNLKLGKSLVHKLDVHLPDDFFNSHIAILGNTGSGKTNTIKQLYRSFFGMLSKQKNKYFVFFDFHNEYSKCFEDYNAKKIKLDVRSDNNNNNNNNKFPILKEYFWDTQLFAVLLNPSEKTQKPKLEGLIQILRRLNNTEEVLDKVRFEIHFTNEELRKRKSLLNMSYANLLNRFYEILKMLFNVIKFTNNDEGTNDSQILLLQFGNADLDLKKIVYLVIVQALYKKQKEQEEKTTTHLIIDEANNILSNEQINETEERKNYRLGLFEEIVREGRKFRFFLTISTQDLWNVTFTMYSQFGNFFIHRLITENDYMKLKGEIVRLDDLSYNKLSILDPGECVAWGSTFKTPLLIGIDKAEETN